MSKEVLRSKPVAVCHSLRQIRIIGILASKIENYSLKFHDERTHEMKYLPLSFRFTSGIISRGCCEEHRIYDFILKLRQLCGNFRDEYSNSPNIRIRIRPGVHAAFAGK